MARPFTRAIAKCPQYSGGVTTSSGVTYDLTTVLGTYNSQSAVLALQPWAGGGEYPGEVAIALGSALGLPNPNGMDPNILSPLFFTHTVTDLEDGLNFFAIADYQGLGIIANVEEPVNSSEVWTFTVTSESIAPPLPEENVPVMPLMAYALLVLAFVGIRRVTRTSS